MKTQETLTRELLALTDINKMANNLIDHVVGVHKQHGIESADFYAEFRKEMNTDELLDQLVPIYAKYFSSEELSGLIAFYKTPLGKKYLDLAPTLSKEAIPIGAKWSEKISNKMLEKLELPKQNG